MEYICNTMKLLLDLKVLIIRPMSVKVFFPTVIVTIWNLAATST